MANRLCLVILLMIMLWGISKSDSECVHQSLLIEDDCYDPHLDRGTTYEIATEICKENGAQVALVSSSKLQRTLTRIVLKQRFDNYWIKTNKLGSVSGKCEALKYENDFEISEEHCDNAMFYICEFGFEVSNSSRYGNSYFQFSEDRRKFSDAQRACKKLDGKIAQVYSEGRHDTLRNSLSKDKFWSRFSDWQIENFNFGYEPKIWAGLKFDVETENWISSNGPAVTVLNSFPQNDNPENCLASNWDSYEISDCEENNVFFCHSKAMDKSLFDSIDMYALLWKNIIQITGVAVIAVYSFLNWLNKAPVSRTSEYPRNVSSNQQNEHLVYAHVANIPSADTTTKKSQ